MHALISRSLLVALVAACNPDAHGPGTGHAETTDEHGSTAHAGESSTTHAHHGTDATTGTTGHEHASETGTTHAPTSEHGSESGTSGGASTPAGAYCECMVVYCHDDYHGTWGEDHETSVAMCEAEANALPSVGMPATQGESIECRVYHCDLAKSDPTACASAIGGGACV